MSNKSYVFLCVFLFYKSQVSKNYHNKEIVIFFVLSFFLKTPTVKKERKLKTLFSLYIFLYKNSYGEENVFFFALSSCPETLSVGRSGRKANVSFLS